MNCHLGHMHIRGWSQKKCTHWQHCVNNEAICPAISSVVLENFWKLVQCSLSPEVCAHGNDRALKWWLFVSQVPWLITISACTSKSTYSPWSSIHFLAHCSNFCKPIKKKFRRLSGSPQQQWHPHRTKNIFQLFLQSGEQVVVQRGQIRRTGWVIKTLEAQAGQFLLGCKC
jgi:hypothetical protein